MEVVQPFKEFEAETVSENDDVALTIKERRPLQNNTTSTCTSANHSDVSSEISSDDEKRVSGNTRNDLVTHNNGDTKIQYSSFESSEEHVDFPVSKEIPSDEILKFQSKDINLLQRTASKHEAKDDIEHKSLLVSSTSLSKMSSPDEHGDYTNLIKQTIENVRANSGSDSLEEGVEVYLENLYQREGPHEFHCPNCKTCITKVIVIERRVIERPHVVPPPEPARDILCTSCLSFLISIGNWIFRRQRTSEVENQVTEVLEQSPDSKETVQAASKDKTPEPVTTEPFLPLSNDSQMTPGLAQQVPPYTVIQKTEQWSVSQSGGATLSDTGLFGDNIQSGFGFGGVPSAIEKLHDRKTPLSDQSVQVNVTVTTPAVPSSERDFIPVSQVPELSVPEKKIPDISITVSTPAVPSSEIDALPVSQAIPKPPELSITEKEKPNISITGPTSVDSTILNIGSYGQRADSRQRSTKTVDIIKSIVYGGLTESITSLGIVTSAASANSTTLNIIALSLANLLGGLFIIGHNLWELKDEQPNVSSNQNDVSVDRYQRLLGKKENFFLHASVAVLSFLVFGLVSPVVYGFSFHQSDNRDLKLAAIAGASLLCITLLAIAKAYVQETPKYIKTVLYYVTIGIAVSGVSYLAGELIDQLLNKLGTFESNLAVTLALPLMGAEKPSWTSY